MLRTAIRSKSDGHHLQYKPLSMDDMPVPKGSWQEHYNKTNSKYNLILVGGIVAFASSIYIVSIIVRSFNIIQFTILTKYCVYSLNHYSYFDEPILFLFYFKHRHVCLNYDVTKIYFFFLNLNFYRFV